METDKVLLSLDEMELDVIIDSVKNQWRASAKRVMECREKGMDKVVGPMSHYTDRIWTLLDQLEQLRLVINPQDLSDWELPT